MAESSPQSGVSPVVRVRTLAQQMREKCLRLDELSNTIGLRAHEDEPGELVRMLGEREPLVVGLARLGDELAAILDDPASARSLGQAEHAQIRTRLGQLEQVMARIRERDKQARAALQRRRDAMADQLGSISVARGAAKAYGGRGGPVNPTMQDAQG